MTTEAYKQRYCEKQEGCCDATGWRTSIALLLECVAGAQGSQQTLVQQKPAVIADVVAAAAAAADMRADTW
jgi:hypothetical protein